MLEEEEVKVDWGGGVTASGQLKYKFNERVYNRMLQAGFTKDEAMFGSTMGHTLDSKSLRDNIEHRENLVGWLMEPAQGLTWGQAVQEAAKQLRAKLKKFTDNNTDDDLITFYESYPEW